MVCEVCSYYFAVIIPKFTDSEQLCLLVSLQRVPQLAWIICCIMEERLSALKISIYESGFLLRVILFTNPSARAGYDTRSIFKRSLTGFNSEFSFSYTSCLTKAEEPSLSYYLPIAGGRIIGFIPSPRVLVLCEMQSVSSRIWTRVAVSISFDDNDYTTGTSFIEGDKVWKIVSIR